MSNTLITCSLLAKESLAILANNLAFAKRVNRNYEEEFTANQSRGYSPGATINIKKPPRYQYRVGRTANPQSTVETSIPLTLTQGGCDINFSSFEMTLSIQQLSQKIQAAMTTVVTEIDRQGLDLARLSTFNCIGTPGTSPNTAALAVQAATQLQQRMTEMGAPLKDRNRALVMSPALNQGMVQGMSGLFNNPATIGKQNDDGMYIDGWGMYAEVDQCVSTHTNGTQVVTGTAVAAGLSGASIACAALGGTITKGTKISFPGVFAVNPQTRQSTGTLAQFVITADVAAAAVALPISPALTPTGNFQNVTNATTAANFTIFGTASGSYSASVAFHKDAYTLACVPLASPPTGMADFHVETDKDTGLSVRVGRAWDIGNDVFITRIDVLFAWAATYPELACLFAL